jgi:hypothetical protein
MPKAHRGTGDECRSKVSIGSKTRHRGSMPPTGLAASIIVATPSEVHPVIRPRRYIRPVRSSPRGNLDGREFRGGGPQQVLLKCFGPGHHKMRAILRWHASTSKFLWGASRGTTSTRSREKPAKNGASHEASHSRALTAVNVAFEVDVLVLERTPQPFDEHVHPAAASTDIELARELPARGCRSLFCGSADAGGRP